MSTKRSERSPAWDLPIRPYRVWLDDDEVFLTRLRFQTPLFAILATRIFQDDTKRAPHTHRRRYISIVLTGGYTEQIWNDPRDHGNTRIREHKRWRPYLLRANQAHKITSIRGKVRTLVFAGFMHRTFYFWTKAGPVDQKLYDR